MFARKCLGLFSLGLLASVASSASVGCVASTADEGAAASHSDALSYAPMGFARVSAAGGLVRGYDSTGGAVSIAHAAGSGRYTVSLPGISSFTGNVQVSGEGADNTRCRTINWLSGGSAEQVNVQCNRPDGTAADGAFSVLFYSETMPTTTNTFPVSAAYAWVNAGAAPSQYNYNTSGHLNTVTRSALGKYTVFIPQATYPNASVMVTAYGGSDSPFCQVQSWGVVSGGMNVYVACWNTSGGAADEAFSISYANSGPTMDQQGAHAWFNGATAVASYSAAMGKLNCSTTSVSGSRAGSNASIIVSGDIGSWSSSPFARASFVSGYGWSAEYCKVTSLTSIEGSPSTSTTNVTCFDGAGNVVATPLFTFTQETSDDSGPC